MRTGTLKPEGLSMIGLYGFFIICTGRKVVAMERMESVKRHFEEEAREYDEIIKKLIPGYPQMVEALVDALPFEKSAVISVIDLGCGTGTVARAVKDVFPSANITCLDIAEGMLQMARLKMADAPETVYINADFSSLDFSGEYDAVVSSLALHHLETDEDKQEFYRKIYSGLKKGGVFANVDVVIASTGRLQQVYIERWKNFMEKSVGREEVENIWIPKYYKEDRPTALTRHLNMLESAGFLYMDVLWKYYNYAVYTALK